VLTALSPTLVTPLKHLEKAVAMVLSSEATTCASTGRGVLAAPGVRSYRDSADVVSPPRRSWSGGNQLGQRGKKLSLARVMGPPDCQGDGTTVARY
jgi:hypothetical protein